MFPAPWRSRRQHGRRGGPMKETYWTQFMATGSVADYLNYKMVEKSAADTKCDKNGNEKQSDRAEKTICQREDSGKKGIT